MEFNSKLFLVTSAAAMSWCCKKTQQIRCRKRGKESYLKFKSKIFSVHVLNNTTLLSHSNRKCKVRLLVTKLKLKSIHLNILRVLLQYSPIIPSSIYFSNSFNNRYLFHTSFYKQLLNHQEGIYYILLSLSSKKTDF